MDSKKTEMFDMYRMMLKIRLFEEEVDRLVAEGKISGTTHLCIGQEAVSVGATFALGDTDYSIGTHRGHGHILSKGADEKKLMAELFGKASGYCKGRGGTQHVAAFDINFLGTNGITGGGIPVGTGAALALKLQNKKNVVLCFLGDGATNQGTFHESLNMAAIWNLPIVYVCENNLYAMSTPRCYSIKTKNIYKRAESYGIRGEEVNGNDVLAVYEAARKHIELARMGNGPALIEAMTYRHKGHSKSDAKVYRTKKEEASWKEKDPLLLFRRRLSEEFAVTSDKFASIEGEIKSKIADAVKFAEQSDFLKE